MKKSIVLTAATALAIGHAAHAGTVEVTYYWTAADIINNQFVDGADGSDAVDNNQYEGARLLRDGTNPGSPDAARTYVESQHSTFNDRWDDLVSQGTTLNSFNLWGLDGRGANWGEDYKPFQWIDVTAPAGWSTGFHDAGPDGLGWFQNGDSAGSGYLDYNTPLFPWFQAGAGNEIALDASQSELESIQFSATIAFDSDEAFWGQDVGDAPNDLTDHLTMWFGANLSSGDMYEGNMLAVIPLPAPVWMGLAGLAGVVVLRKCYPLGTG